MSLQTGFHAEAWIWLPLGYPAMPSRCFHWELSQAMDVQLVTGVPELMQSDGPGKADGLCHGIESRIKEY